MSHNAMFTELQPLRSDHLFISVPFYVYVYCESAATAAFMLTALAAAISNKLTEASSSVQEQLAAVASCFLSPLYRH